MSEITFHPWLPAEKQLSVKVEKGMGGKYAHTISYGGRVEDRDEIIRVLREVDQRLEQTFGSKAA